MGDGPAHPPLADESLGRLRGSRRRRRARGRVASPRRRASRTERVEELPQPAGVALPLRPYQLAGFRWLAFSGRTGSAGCSPTTWASARRRRRSR
jgi:SNF2 family DNA or RNA helicase